MLFRSISLNNDEILGDAIKLDDGIVSEPVTDGFNVRCQLLGSNYQTATSSMVDGKTCINSFGRHYTSSWEFCLDDLLFHTPEPPAPISDGISDFESKIGWCTFSTQVRVINQVNTLPQIQYSITYGNYDTFAPNGKHIRWERTGSINYPGDAVFLLQSNYHLQNEEYENSFFIEFQLIGYGELTIGHYQEWGKPRLIGAQAHPQIVEIEPIGDSNHIWLNYVPCLIRMQLMPTITLPSFDYRNYINLNPIAPESGIFQSGGMGGSATITAGISFTVELAGIISYGSKLILYFENMPGITIDALTVSFDIPNRFPLMWVDHLMFDE